MGQTSNVSDGRCGNRENSGKTAANASITLGGNPQNCSRALTVKSGQSSADLLTGTPTFPGGELGLHFRSGDDAVRTESPIQVLLQ